MLNVYRASAGSGKTYQLTLEYIKLLLAPPQNEEGLLPGERQRLFRRILAVTFTNKATDEMKQRIVRQLDILAHDPESSEYIGQLLGRDGITADIGALKRQAAEQLYTLLHDFSGFNISTIDRFFQQITRSFMHEIGYSGGYNIELDSSMVLNEAIDNLFFDLEKRENRELLKWLVDYARQQVEEDSYKNFRKKIDELAEEIFKEEFKSQSEILEKKLQDKQFLARFIASLDEKKRTFEKQVHERADAALTLLSQNGLSPEDFKYGNRSGATLLRKWAGGNYALQPNDRFRQMAENSADKWYTKGKTPDDIVEAMSRIEPIFHNVCREIVRLYGAPYADYLSALHTKKYLYTLGIINDIVTHIQDYQSEHGTLLLSDTNDLLRKIIRQDDTPFVYEKIGTYIDHFFIDEFQDTSATQWKNFYPLIKESNDRGLSNLLVGDVKQSIYRWRNSDWELLNEKLPDYFPQRELHDETLDTNWRSEKEVVRFNNTFFDRAAARLQQTLNENLPPNLRDDESLCQKIELAYRNAAQKTGRKNAAEGGYVEIDFFENTRENEEESRAKDKALRRTVEVLRDLQDRGVALRDIAILVRTKDEGNRIVQHLLHEQASAENDKYRYDVISDEALYISNSSTVQLIIALLDYLRAPQEALTRFMALYSIETAYRKTVPDKAIPGICNRLQKDDAEELLCRIEKFRGEPLYEICEKIIDLFPVDTTGDENVFIQAFLDLVLQYTEKRSSDPNSFLLWWHDKGVTRSLSTPQEQDAVRIMTIHKSKGLEFKIVIIPFCNWTIDHRSTHAPILWAETTAPFDTLPIVPIAYNSELAATQYARTYFTEQIHTYIDNLNLAYVAFTRAREELHIFVPKISGLNIGTLLQQCIEEDTPVPPATDRPYANLHDGYDPETGRYMLGTPAPLKEKSGHAPSQAPAPYRSTPPGKRLHLRLMGQGFFDPEDRRHHGSVCHRVLSSIATADDITPAMQKHIQAGEISETDAAEIESMLRQQLAEPEKQRWFKAGNRILNERDILHPRQGTYRPDRVVIDGEGATVIDYKFGAERTVHNRQVAGYMHLLEEMGYKTRGYIWYVPSGKVVPVEG